NYLYGLGNDWGFTWRSVVYYTPTGTNLNTASFYVPGGGRFTFTGNGTSRDFRTYCSVTVLRDGANNITGFSAQTPSGGTQILDYIVSPTAGTYLAYITKDIDPQNRTNV